MKSSLQIHNEIRDLDGRIAKATADFAAAEGDARDALRDAINEYKGEQKALSDMLGDVLAAEDEVRRGGGVPLAAGTLEAPKSPRTLAEELLGPRDGFSGLEFGDKLTLDVRDASDKPYTNLGLPARRRSTTTCRARPATCPSSSASSTPCPREPPPPT